MASRFVKLGVLVCSQAIVTFAVVEIGYRVYRYSTVGSEITRIVSSHASNVLRIPDPHSGYRYPPNLDQRLSHPFHSHWTTNSHGHIATEDYAVSKPTNEFRIAAVGDSFTANITSNVRWPDLLQQKLNASETWRDAVGKKFSRVINFGIDGTGFQQYVGVVHHHVPPFDADLILINFMVDDAWRRWRGVNPHLPREQIISDAVRKDYLSAINWMDYSCSLVIATIRHTKCLDIPSDMGGFVANRARQFYTFVDRQEAIEKSTAALRSMMKAANVLFTRQPAIEELSGAKVPAWDGIIEDIQRNIPDWSYFDLKPAMMARAAAGVSLFSPHLRGLSAVDIGALPDTQKPEIYRWFYVPHDTHYTDYGNEVYAEELAKALIGGLPFTKGAATAQPSTNTLNPPLPPKSTE